MSGRERRWLRHEYVVLLLGVSFIAVAMVRNTMRQREHKRLARTANDIRSLASAIEARATDLDGYPQVASVDELVPLLSPVYSRAVTIRDGWGRPFRYETRRRFADCGVVEAGGYVLASAGRDGRFSGATERYLARRELPFEQEVRELAARHERERSDVTYRLCPAAWKRIYDEQRGRDARHVAQAHAEGSDDFLYADGEYIVNPHYTGH
jgi:hypothetical protein